MAQAQRPQIMNDPKVDLARVEPPPDRTRHALDQTESNVPPADRLIEWGTANTTDPEISVVS